jgi:beta-mannanase
MMIGAFTEDGEATFPGNGEAGIRAYERLIGRKLAQVLWFLSFDDPFPAKACQTVIDHGSIPQLTWELFWQLANPSNSDIASTGLDDVLAHKHDAYIDAFARGAAACGKPILIRFLHEFNGNWHPWGGFKNGSAAGGPERVKAVWKYVVDGFRAAGGTNVLWLWCPHGPMMDVPTDAWNDMENYYPGDDYVDWFGMDGYNWYPKDPWGGTRPLQDFDAVFKVVYGRLVALAAKPIAISEMASGEFTYGQITKTDWVIDTFTRMKRYPALRMYSWYNINKELDWRVNSSPAALAAFRKAMSDPYFRSEYEDPRPTVAR